jgi:hypothetical protein
MSSRVSRKKKVLLVLGLLAVPLVACGWIAFRDEPPPADFFLRSVRRRSVKQEDNGFRLVRLTDEEVWHHEDEPMPEWYSPTIDTKIAEEFVERNAAVIEKIDRCLTLPGFQVELPETSTSPRPYLSGWSQVTDVLALRARLHLDSRRVPEAFEDAMRLTRFGRRIRISQGDLYVYVLGTNLETLGLQVLVYTAIRGTMAPDGLRRGIRLLGEERSPSLWLADALKTEYVAITKAFEQMASGELVERDLHRGWNKWRLGWPFFKPNQAARYLAEGMTPLISSADIPAYERTLDLESRGAGDDNPTGSLFAGSKFMAEYFLVALRGSLTHTDVNSFQLGATRTLLALLLARAETSSLPASLEALVPRYLTAVPLDPFSGEPLHYSSSERIIYSVGIDGEDGGSAQEDPLQAFQDSRSRPCVSPRRPGTWKPWRSRGRKGSARS